MAISVNIFGLTFLIEAHARSKNGQPPQKTTGTAKANCIQILDTENFVGKWSMKIFVTYQSLKSTTFCLNIISWVAGTKSIMVKQKKNISTSPNTLERTAVSARIQLL